MGLAPLFHRRQVLAAGQDGAHTGLGVVKNLFFRTDGVDAAIFHDGDPVGHTEDLVPVMGYQQHALAKGTDHAADLLLQAEAQMAVQGTEGLVQQQNVRVRHQDAGQGHALLLSAGQLMGQALGQRSQTKALHDLSHHLLPTVFILFSLGAGADILQHRHIGEQGIILKHQSYTPLLGRQVDVFFRVK